MDRNGTGKKKIGLMLLCLCVCAALMGTTRARYEQVIGDPQDVLIASDELDAGAALDQVYLHGGPVDAQWLEKNTLPELPSGWMPVSGGAELKFSITNFTVETGLGLTDPARRNQQFRVQLIAGLGIGKPQNLTVTLTRVKEIPPVIDEYGMVMQIETEEETVYTASPSPITKGTPLYHTFGEGWVYRFYDETGKEILFDLEGNTFAYQNFILQVSGEIGQSMLTLQAIGTYSE